MRFFISSTYTDLKDTRNIAINILNGIVSSATDATGKVIAMEYFNASENSCKEVCISELDRCDLVIGIYGEKYGSIDEETGLSMTEVEFDYAVDKGLPILAFVKRTNSREQKETEFINNKVFALRKSCAHFDTNEDFADRLNSSIKEYFTSLDGYSVDSLWSQINNIKAEILNATQNESTDYELHMVPYSNGQEYIALDSIISSAEQIRKFLPSIASENDAIYSYAYTFEFYPENTNDSTKTEVIGNIESISKTILSNWELINLGLENHITRIILAASFLKFHRMQHRLLYEPWSETLRQEVIATRKAYLDTILSSTYID